jgi:hypothetical protein
VVYLGGKRIALKKESQHRKMPMDDCFPMASRLSTNWKWKANLVILLDSYDITKEEIIY